MKIRYGHVTNSSSSSFLLLIDRKTKSALGSVDDIVKSKELWNEYEGLCLTEDFELV